VAAAAALERVYVGSDGGDAYVSHVPDRVGEVVIEFDPSSYSPAVDGPAICRVVVPDAHPARALPKEQWPSFVMQQVAAAWPTMQVGARMAHRRLQRQRRR
jgi:hypothetical protein